MAETNLTKCEIAFQVTYHPIYRFAQFWTFFVSLLAIPALVYFLLKRIFQLPFHGNLKSMLICYFLATTLFSMNLCFAFGYHFFIPFFAISKCSLIIDASLFGVVHIMTTITMTIPMILPIGFTIERFVALAMARDYENTRTLLGPLYVLSVALIDAKMIYDIFRNEKFTDNFVSFILIPSTAAVQFNNFFWLLLYTEIGNFIANCLLLLVHKSMKQRYLRHRSTLSTRYAIEEVSISSQFTLIVSFTHLLFVSWYLIAIIFTRTAGPAFFNGYINYTVARGVYCAVPTYNLVIVFIGTISLKLLNTRRHKKVQSTIQLKSTGSEGALNYQDAISRHWDSISSGMARLSTF